MEKHPHTDSCCKELKGIVISRTSPICCDVVWLQPIKPGLFRWMIHTDGHWMPVAVEQPLPKNALLSYLYEKSIGNSSSSYKFYTESETEALLGSYIYDEDGNVSMRGMLDFHCDDTQDENKITFSQTIENYELDINTYIRQFYDKIVLSVSAPESSHNITLNSDGFFYNDSEVVNLSSLSEHLKNLFYSVCALLGVNPETLDPNNLTEQVVTSIITTTSATYRNNVPYYLLSLSPATRVNGAVSISGFLNNSSLESWMEAYMSDNMEDYLSDIVTRIIEDPDFAEQLQRLFTLYIEDYLENSDFYDRVYEYIANKIEEAAAAGVITDVKIGGYYQIKPDITAVTGTIESSGTIQIDYGSNIPTTKHETVIILQASMDTKVAFPTGDYYEIVDGNTQYELTAGQWIEINYLTIGSKVYIRSGVY